MPLVLSHPLFRSSMPSSKGGIQRETQRRHDRNVKNTLRVPVAKRKYCITDDYLGGENQLLDRN